jgi:hypothetical protein
MTDANGLINMRARYYNPLTMRFLNSDPAMDGLNWYAYANGNPINFADPTGYGAQKVLGAMNSGLNSLGMVTNSFLNLVPGQAAWQNSVASAQSGNYGQAAAHFGIMAAEQVLTVASLGTSASVGAVSRAGSTAVTAARVEAAVVGRSGEPLVNAVIQPIRNQATTISERQFTGHALDQMQNRGFMPSVVENTIKQGTIFPTRAGTTGFYDSLNNVRVITDSASGRVVTVIPGAP